MKKTFLFLLILATITACTSDDSFKASTPSIHRARSVIEAQSIAKDSYEQIFGRNSRSENSKEITVSNTIILKGRPARSTAPDTLLYIVNLGEDAGFAVISANAESEALLGISNRGNYDPNENEGNCNFELFLEKASDYAASGSAVTSSIGGPFGPLIPADSLGVDTVSHYNPEEIVVESLDPLIEFEWGTGYPYGMYCTNGTASCVAVSLGMIAAHFRDPESCYVSNWGYTIFDWGEISGHQSTGSGCAEINPNSAHVQIAKLIQELDDRVLNGDILSSIMAFFGDYYCPESDTIAESRIPSVLCLRDLDSMERNHVVIAYAKSESENIYHSWLIDGYKKIRSVTTFWPYVTSTSTYFHCNWGCDGKCNGYFLAGVYDTSNSYQYDGSQNNLAHEYNFDIQYYNLEKNLIEGR